MRRSLQILLAASIGASPGPATASESRAVKDAIAALQAAGAEIVREDRGNPSSPILEVFFDSEGSEAALVHLRAIPTLTRVSLPPAVTDKGLIHLTGLARISDLYLGWTQVTGKGLSYLKDLPLETVRANSTPFDDVGLAQLKNFPKLKVVDLAFTKISDAGLAQLKGLPELKVVNLAFTKISDAGLESLGVLPSLTELRLAGTAIGDDGLEMVVRNSSIETLDLGSTKVTDAGLVHIAKLKNLRELNLADTGIGDTGLLHLKSGLRELNLRSTQVTVLGLKHLQDLSVPPKVLHDSLVDPGGLRGLRPPEVPSARSDDGATIVVDPSHFALRSGDGWIEVAAKIKVAGRNWNVSWELGQKSLRTTVPVGEYDISLKCVARRGRHVLGTSRELNVHVIAKPRHVYTASMSVSQEGGQVSCSTLLVEQSPQ